MPRTGPPGCGVFPFCESPKTPYRVCPDSGRIINRQQGDTFRKKEMLF